MGNLPWKLLVFIFGLSKGDWLADEIAKNQLSKAENLKTQLYISLNNECKSKTWGCQRECRLQFFEDTGSCNVPNDNDYCFGSKILYNYTWNPSIKHFPKEYEFVKRFPKCWSYLGPLLCSTIYRPCSKNSYMQITQKEPAFIELWQVFPEDLCIKAKKECNFLDSLGLWPSHLDCDNNVALDDDEYPTHFRNMKEKQLFTNSSKCKMKNDLEARFTSEQCLWPLVKGSKHLELSKKAINVLDSCYLPCKTPIAGFDWIIEMFRKRNGVISGLSLIIFIGIAVYLVIFSKIYHTSLSIYCLTQGFFAISIYLMTWALTLFDNISESIMCIDDGKMRKNSEIESLDSCTIESVVNLYGLIASYLWLTVVILLRIIRPKIRDDNYIIYGSRSNEISARTLLGFIIYLLLPVILIIVAIFTWDKPPMDALSGLCHVTSGSIQEWMIIYGIQGGLILLIILSWLGVSLQKKLQQKRLEASLEKNPRINKKEKLISSIEVDGDEELKDVVVNDRKQIKTEDNDVNSYVLEHGLGDGLIPEHWLVAIFGTILCGSVISFILQYVVVYGNIGDNIERELIVDSITCSIQSTISETNHGWWNATINNDHLTTITDPYIRKESLFNSINAPGCDIPLIKESTFLAVFLSSIVIPCLPYWVAAVCFFTGFCGSGIKSVNKIRNKYNPFIRNGYKKKVKFIKNDMDHGFLQSDNEKKSLIKEDIEMQSQATAPTNFSAPARLESDVALDDEDPGLPSLTDNESTAVVGASSIHSEPINSRKFNRIRKIDLKKKYKSYRRDRYFEEQLHNAISNGSYVSQYTDQLIGNDEDSELNLTSISQRIVPISELIKKDTTINELRIKYDEINNQNYELMITTHQTMNMLNSLRNSYCEMKNSFDMFVTKVDTDRPQCPAVTETKTNETTDNTNNLINLVPNNIPGKAYSTSSGSTYSQRARLSPKRRMHLMKIRIEAKAKKAVTKEMIELPSVYRNSRDLGDTSEDDEVNIEVPEWSLPNPPIEMINLRNMLMTAEFMGVELPPPDELKQNLFYRLAVHCASFLPDWLKNTFMDEVRLAFEDYYFDDDGRSSLFDKYDIYPDTEPIEAADDENLYDYCWPLICKAIYNVSAALFIDIDKFSSNTTEWVQENIELSKLSNTLNEGDLSSVLEEFEADNESDISE